MAGILFNLEASMAEQEPRSWVVEIRCFDCGQYSEYVYSLDSVKTIPDRECSNCASHRLDWRTTRTVFKADGSRKLALTP